MEAKIFTANQDNFNSSTEQLELSSNTIPIPKPFLSYNKDQELFIVNPEDKSVFKWIQVIGALKPNGITDKTKTEYGRRNYNGIFEAKFDRENYRETSDLEFRNCIKKYGGFYISVYKARYESEDHISYAGTGSIVDRINYSKAREIATSYMVNHFSNKDFITDLPCGAAMDCIYEAAFELLEKEVLEKQLPGERKYYAWNRIAKSKDYRQSGVMGIHDFFTGEAEITTEAFTRANYHVVVRDGNRGLFSICYSDYEKDMFDSGRIIHFELGQRNFISKEAEFSGYGFRLMLLPI